MPGIIKSDEEVRGREKEEEEIEKAEEGVRKAKDKTAVLKDSELGEDMDEEMAREPLSGRSVSPEADLDHSSTTQGSSEGESNDSKNGDSASQDGSEANGLDQPGTPAEKQEDDSPDEEDAAKHRPRDRAALKGEEREAACREVTTINIRLVLPGISQPIQVMMSSRDTVHDLYQLLLERHESCYRTCVSAWFHKRRLDDFCELGMVEDLRQGGTIELVEDLYTQKDIRIHLQRLKELLTVDPLQQALTYTDGMSLSLLAAITLKDPEELSTRGSRDEFVDILQLEPPPYCLPKDGNPPLSSFFPPSLESHFKVPECVKSISYSQWNPPPSHRRMKGDLLYLEVVTLEGQEYYVTACPTGFYLNRSTSRDVFDPTPKKTSHHSTHLVGLLSAISPMFKKAFTTLQKFGEKRHAYELLPIYYPLYPWLALKPEHKPTAVRFNDGMQLKAAPDELIMGQMRDWNEEVQTAREMPVDTPQLKVFRDRTLYKIHCDFVQVATRGAMLVVDGFIPALNPGDEEKFRMFLWNNLFFSLAFDGRDHYKAFGGDDAAHAAAAGDLHGVEVFERLEVKGISTLQTAVVDYRGYRVVCQSIIPGLLWREQEAAVVYGSIDGGKTIGADSKFCELLQQVASDLHIRPHKLRTEKGDVVELPTSLEVKGILGTDNRRYALDLFRLFPPDPNYTELEEEEKGKEEEKEEGEEEGREESVRKERREKDVKKEEKKTYRHKLAVLRPELIETFMQYRYLLFLKLAKDKATKLSVIQDLQKVLAGKGKVSTNGEQSDSAGATPPAKTSGGKSQSGTESRQEKPAACSTPGKVSATKGAVPSAQQQSQDSKPESDLSSPNSSPESKRKVESSLPRLSTVGGMVGRSHIAILGGRGGGKEDGSAGLTLLEREGEEEVEEEDLQTLSLTSSGSGDVVLMDGLQLLVEEKEVEESESLPGAGDLPVSGAAASAEELEKNLKTSDILKSHPEVMAALQDAAREAGSVGGEKFDIQFNVDLLSPGVQHADPAEVLEKDRKLLHEATFFLTELVIPQMVRECIHLSLVPTDGQSLEEAMHSRGINMRYLGRVAKLASTREDLAHLKRLCISEMIVRAAKRKLRLLLQKTPYERVSEAIAHFLNCFLGHVEVSKEEAAMVNGHHSKKKQKKKKGSKGLHPPEPPHLKLTPAGLWSDIVKELEDYYKYNMEQCGVVEMCSQHGLNRTILLRELCKKTGIQMVAQDYDFSSRTPFSDEDIASLFPITKHTHYKSTESTLLFELAQSKFKAGYFRSAHDCYMDALQMFVQIFGPLHIDVANCYRQVAKIHYVVGEPLVALSYQHKAVLVYERVLGVDHPETVTSYINLAIYCHNTNQTTVALRLMFRARYLLLLMCGEDHPEVATCDCNIALMLHSIKLYDSSLQFLQNSLRVFEKYHGKQSLQVALTHHLIARVQSFLGDFRAALQHEKSTYSIYNHKYGTEHERTKESSSCLQELTEKAVAMQKTINEMTGKSGGGGGGGGGKVMFDLPGSWGDVVSMINAPEPNPRHHPRGQKPVHTKTHVVRRRNKPSKQQQSATKSGDKPPSSHPE